MENKPFHKYRSVWEHAELMERKGIYYGLVMAQREMSKMADGETGGATE